MNGSAFLAALPLCWKLSKRWEVVIKIGIGIEFLLVTHLSKDATFGRFLSSSTSTSTNSSSLQIVGVFHDILIVHIANVGFQAKHGACTVGDVLRSLSCNFKTPKKTPKQTSKENL